MRRVSVAYGPPGAAGVSTLMSVGDVPVMSSQQRLGELGGKVAVGVWLLGLATGNSNLKRVAFWGGIASLGFRVLSK